MMNTENKFWYSLRAILILVLLSALNVGCGDCNKVDCMDDDVSSVEINFIQNDLDIVFGGASLVQADDIIISSTTESDIPFSTFDDQISLWLEGDRTYTIVVGDIDTVSIQGVLRELDTDDCCSSFEFVSFTMDGQEICNTNCTTINIELE